MASTPPTIVKQENDELTVLNSSRPNKRRRAALEDDAKEDSDNKKIKLKKPKVKEPERHKLLDEESVRSRLELIGFDVFPIPADAAEASTTATRHFYSSYFGGSLRRTFSKTGKTHRNPKKRNFMACKFDWNPEVPLIPGAPGLFFGDDPEPEWADPDYRQTVLVRVENNQWMYVGEYKIGPAPLLSVEEWVSLPKDVKSTWCLGSLQYKWGRRIRAVISLRKRLGREPTKAELEEILASNNEMPDVTPAQIGHEFDEGREHIQIYTMKCTGYDEEIPRTITAHSAVFEEARVAAEAAARKGGNVRQGKREIEKRNGTLSPISKRGTRAVPSRLKKSKNEKVTEVIHTYSATPRRGRRVPSPRKYVEQEPEAESSELEVYDSGDDYIP